MTTIISTASILKNGKVAIPELYPAYTNRSGVKPVVGVLYRITIEKAVIRSMVALTGKGRNAENDSLWLEFFHRNSRPEDVELGPDIDLDDYLDPDPNMVALIPETPLEALEHDYWNKENAKAEKHFGARKGFETYGETCRNERLAENHKTVYQLRAECHD